MVSIPINREILLRASSAIWDGFTLLRGAEVLLCEADSYEKFSKQPLQPLSPEEDPVLAQIRTTLTPLYPKIFLGDSLINSYCISLFSIMGSGAWKARALLEHPFEKVRPKSPLSMPSLRK